jgi:hypothetical protein
MRSRLRRDAVRDATIAETDRGPDLTKTAVLPIVTLVLGYSFGKSGRTGG